MRRYKHAIEMVKLNKNDNVLDIGCGVGYQIHKIASKCKNYIGIDFSKKSIKLCKKTKNAKLIVADAHEIPFKKDYFDVILMIDVLHNLYDPRKALNEAKKVLKEDGKIVISVANRNSFYGLTRYALDKLGKWNYKLSPPINNWYSFSSIISLIESENFVIEKVRGSFFLPPFFTGKFYLIPAFKSIPKIYDKTENFLSIFFKYFGYHIILCCSKKF